MAMSGNWWWSSVALYGLSGDKNISLTDSFTGTDTVALIVKEIALSDPATFTDTPFLLSKDIPLAETFTFGDLIALITKEVWLDEQAIFGEVIEIQGQIICDRFVEVFDYASTFELLGFSVDIQDMATMSEFVSIFSGENKSIVIAESLHSTELTPLNKRLTIQDQISLSEFVSRMLELIDSFSAEETILRDKIFDIIDSVTLTDTIANTILIALQDNATFTDLLARIVDCRENFTFEDLLSVLQSRSRTDTATFGEMITISRSFDSPPTFTPPDDITEVIKDKFIEVDNPKKIR